MLTFENETLDVLRKLNQKGKSFISGGYIRDKILNLKPNDIDIITELKLEDVKKIFPQLQWTAKGKDFGVGRFNRKGFLFEISSFNGKTLEEAISQKDFTINSLYHDGNTLYDPFNALLDINSKTIRSLETPEKHFMRRPQAYLRALRLSGQLDFKLNDELLTFMKNNTHIFQENNENRIQQEGYKIINSINPITPFELLGELNLIDFKKESILKETEFTPPIENKNDIKLTLISQYIKPTTIFEFIELFKLKNELKVQIEQLLPYLGDHLPTKPHLLNKVILLKKHQFYNENQKYLSFLNKIKKNK